jgi:YVTN family beta-propeller protein
MRSAWPAGSTTATGNCGRRWPGIYLGAVSIIISLAGESLPAFAQEKTTPAALQQSSGERPRQAFTAEGISVEFSIEPIPSATRRTSELLSESEATVRFKIVEANGGKPLTNLRPAAWIDRRESKQAPDARGCREKIQSFLQHSFNRRASIDLNTYFLLVLNREPNISVIDPLSGFGGTKLYTLVDLVSPGEDWALSSDKNRLYVSMPQSGQVAAIDTATWKVIANIDAGVRPTRVVLQHDGRYLWVGNPSSIP